MPGSLELLGLRVGRRTAARERLQPEIAELRHHGLAGMKLQGQDPAHGPHGFAIIDDVHRLLPVDEMLQVIALGDDDIIVPIPLFDGLLKFL